MTPAPRKGQPARTVTMLFTDIEGSTVLLRRLGSRWGAALSAHRSIVRAAVTACGGDEMGTEGDSFFVVFASAHEAVRAAVTAQRELQGHPWPQDQRCGYGSPPASRPRPANRSGRPGWPDARTPVGRH